MSGGIRTTVEFDDPEICPIAKLSSDAGTRVRAVSTSVCTDDCSSCVTDFVLRSDEPPDSPLEPIFSRGDVHRYRLERDEGVDCPCEMVGSHGCGVDRYVAEDGELTLSFYADGYDELREVVADLRERYSSLDVKRLVRSPAEDVEVDDVVVDRGKLTDRQREVLETAYRMGYFERPRRANATEVAEQLDVQPSTVSEHLTAAQAKILDDLFLD